MKSMRIFTSIMWPWENLLSSETESATVAKLSIYRGLVLHDGAMISNTKLMEYKYIQILIFTWICFISCSFGDVIISRCKKECQNQVRYNILFVDFPPTLKTKNLLVTRYQKNDLFHFIPTCFLEVCSRLNS